MQSPNAEDPTHGLRRVPPGMPSNRLPFCRSTRSDVESHPMPSSLLRAGCREHSISHAHRVSPRRKSRLRCSVHYVLPHLVLPRQLPLLVVLLLLLLVACCLISEGEACESSPYLHIASFVLVGSWVGCGPRASL
eukprot:scaffold23975_cov112-Isochrysis_galbana.AAC.1